MAPHTIRKFVCRTGKKCLKAIKKFAHPRGQAETLSPDPDCAQTDLTTELRAVTENLNVVELCTEDCKSNVTTVTWLDDVTDLEDMQNRLNEALEVKMMTSIAR